MDYEALTPRLVSWIKEKVTSAGSRGVVLGLSGGIDSSVIAGLCKRAFPETTLGLIMPCYSDPADEKFARMVSEKFNIKTVKVDLSPVYDAFLKALSSDKDKDDLIAVSNIKVRLRMTTLYYFANKFKYFVVGSGDLSEITVGYFTKYGDGAADILPLGKLLKTQVRELGSYLGVPKVIVEKPSTPGLWSGHTAEGELGVSYEDIDRYVITGKATPEVKVRIESLKKASQHKREMPTVPDF